MKIFQLTAFPSENCFLNNLGYSFLLCWENWVIQNMCGVWSFVFCTKICHESKHFSQVIYRLITLCYVPLGRGGEGKGRKLKKSFLKCVLHSGFRFHLIKILLQCPPPLIVSWNSESLVFVSGDKCYSHVLSWHLWDELSIWREGRTFDASSVILGPPLFWEALTHVVWAVKPSGRWDRLIPLLINVPEGPCHPLPPSRVLVLKKEPFICSTAGKAGQRSSGANNFPSFVWVIRGQPQETDSGFTQCY